MMSVLIKPPAALHGAAAVADLLGIAFIILKLMGHIDWSWLWVLSPFWFPPAVFVGAFVGYLLLVSLVTASAGLFRRHRKPHQ